MLSAIGARKQYAELPPEIAHRVMVDDFKFQLKGAKITYESIKVLEQIFMTTKQVRKVADTLDDTERACVRESRFNVLYCRRSDGEFVQEHDYPTITPEEKLTFGYENKSGWFIRFNKLTTNSPELIELFRLKHEYSRLWMKFRKMTGYIGTHTAIMFLVYSKHLPPPVADALILHVPRLPTIRAALIR